MSVVDEGQSKYAVVRREYFLLVGSCTILVGLVFGVRRKRIRRDSEDNVVLALQIF